MKPMQAGDVIKTWANVDGLGADFNYKPGCSVERGIAQFMKWYNQFYNSKF
jgi:UDP-glucuronate 4-epimerase